MTSLLLVTLMRSISHGFRLKQSKCSLFQSYVEFLGHTIDAQGVQCQAIVKAHAPTDITELCSFLGLLNYYGRFIPNLASLLHPLNQLLCKGVDWKWSEECAQTFKVAKEALVLAQVLAQYDPELPLLLTADTLSYGVGAVSEWQSIYNCHLSSTLDLPAGSSKANSFPGCGSFAAVGHTTISTPVQNQVP